MLFSLTRRTLSSRRYDFAEWDDLLLTLRTGGRDAVGVRARTMPDSEEMLSYLCAANGGRCVHCTHVITFESAELRRATIAPVVNPCCWCAARTTRRPRQPPPA